MEIEELRKRIEQKTGIPAQILTADTEPDLIAQARSLIRFRDDQEGQRKKTTAEQFSDLVNSQIGQPQPEPDALSEIENDLRIDAGGYPSVSDGGNPYINGRTAPDPRPTEEQFSAWLNDQLSWNPNRGEW